MSERDKTVVAVILATYVYRHGDYLISSIISLVLFRPEGLILKEKYYETEF